MGALSDSVGTIAVNISGDYSDLTAALDDAQHYAEQSSEKIAEAFNETGAASDKTSESFHELESSAEETEGRMGKFSESLVELASELGLIIGLKELISETFEAFSRVEDATIAMTALTGSADLAREQLEQVEELATSENLSFPALLEATQRMDAFGFSIELIPAALQAAADAAVATNKSIDQTANAIERIAATGMAGGRQLQSLGLTTRDLAAAMGIAEGEVKKTFAALDQETRLELVTLALQKFAGLGKESASTLSRDWQGVKNTFEEMFKAIGDLTAPAAKLLLDFAKLVGQGWLQMASDLRDKVIPQVKFFWDEWIHGADEAKKHWEEFQKTQAKQQGSIEKPTRVFTQQSFATEFNKDLNTHQWEEATKLIQQLAQTDLPGAQTAMKKLVEAEWEFNAAITTGKVDRYRAITKDFTGELGLQVAMYDKAVAAQKAYVDEVAKFGESINALELGLTTAEVHELFLNDAQLQTTAGLKAMADSIPPVVDDVGNLSTTGERVIKTWQELNKETQDWNKTLNNMLGKAKPQLDAFHEEMRKINADLASGNFGKMQTAIDQLAKISLPAAVIQQDKLAAAVLRGHVSYQELTSTLQKQIDMHTQLGQSMNEEIIKLANIEEAHKILIATTNIAGNAYKGLLNAINQFGAGLAHTLSVGIVEGQKFSQVWQQIWKGFAEAILQVVITALELLVTKKIAALLGLTSNDQNAAASQISSQAGIAFAAAFASVMSSVPFPLNIGLAPAVAEAAGALTEAGGMSFVSAGKAEQGALLSKDMLVSAHADEMILPAALSEGLQDMISGNKATGGPGFVLQIGTMHGVTRDTVDALATQIFRKARLAGAFR